MCFCVQIKWIWRKSGEMQKETLVWKPKIEKPSDRSHIECVVSVTFCFKVPKV